jgi:hypothetical protein
LFSSSCQTALLTGDYRNAQKALGKAEEGDELVEGCWLSADG